jgi:hypothetical protein
MMLPLASVEPLKITWVTCCPVRMTRLERGGIGSMYPALESERVWLCELIVEGVIMTPSERGQRAVRRGLARRFNLAWFGSNPSVR